MRHKGADVLVVCRRVSLSSFIRTVRSIGHSSETQILLISGTCIHLFTSFRFQNEFLDQQPPEIHRTPLEQICLRIKILPFLQGPIEQVLSKVVEPPSLEAVRAAISTLRTLRALTKEEDLTPLGFHLGRLPVDVRVCYFFYSKSLLVCLHDHIRLVIIFFGSLFQDWKAHSLWEYFSMFGPCTYYCVGDERQVSLCRTV